MADRGTFIYSTRVANTFRNIYSPFCRYQSITRSTSGRIVRRSERCCSNHIKIKAQQYRFFMPAMNYRASFQILGHNLVWFLTNLSLVYVLLVPVGGSCSHSTVCPTAFVNTLVGLRELEGFLGSSEVLD